MADIVGWTASMILLATVIRQVIKQAQSVGAQGVSAWLFLGQATASALFVIYAILLDNWVFIITNSFLLVTALVGQAITWRQQQKSNPKSV